LTLTEILEESAHVVASVNFFYVTHVIPVAIFFRLLSVARP